MRTLAHIGRNLKGNSSKILVGVAIGTGILGMISMYRRAPKIKAIIDKKNEELTAVQDMIDNPEKAIEEGYVDNIQQLPATATTDIKVIKTNAFFDVCKELIVPVVLEAASVACIIGSHKIVMKQNAALATAAGAAIKEFKDYRESVVDRFGEDVDKELRYGVKNATIEKIEKDENGKEKKVKEKIQEVDADKLGHSQYAVIFDSCSRCWSDDPWTNKAFLKGVQKDANAKLIRQGFLFLNDVRKMLGLDPCVAGQVVGWIWDPEETDRDNHVDFNIFNSPDPFVRRFLDGYENCVVLDFNVDGVIIDDVQSRHLLEKF